MRRASVAVRLMTDGPENGSAAVEEHVAAPRRQTVMLLDEGDIQQSPVNVFNNAIRHSPTGSQARVRIGTPPDVLRFRVAVEKLRTDSQANNPPLERGNKRSGNAAPRGGGALPLRSAQPI